MGKHYLVNDSLFYAHNPYVQKNPYLHTEVEDAPLPTYAEAKDRLPRPVWQGRDDVLACYDKVWEIAFCNLRKPNAAAGFVSNFIDTAFNGYLFMWDSSFIVMFGRYGSHVFNFQKTLDNFYSHQHKDGFICREICESEPGEQFQRDDPASTGPNIMPWCEWEYYRLTGDKERLSRVFYPLLAYHKWLQLNRTWRDGSYWSCGLACGMDNQPRVESHYCEHASHGHGIWVDACIQMVISGKVLIEMGKVLDCEQDTEWLVREVEMLTELINDKLWSEQDAFYYDMWRLGLSGVKSIGAYWSLLADIVPPERLPRLIAHLELLFYMAQKEHRNRAKDRRAAKLICIKPHQIPKSERRAVSKPAISLISISSTDTMPAIVNQMTCSSLPVFESICPETAISIPSPSTFNTKVISTMTSS